MQMCVCGVANTDEAKFCSGCGKELEAPLPRCKGCGAERLPGAGFCTGCGAAVDDAKIAAAKVEAAPRPAETDHVIAMAWQPIRTLERARLMAASGALGAAIVALFSVLVSFSFPPEDRPLRFLVAAFYLACAVGMWRGWLIAAVAACGVYALDIFVTLQVLAASPGGPTTSDTATFVVLFAVLPAALICGLRGCWAWRNFVKQGAT